MQAEYKTCEVVSKALHTGRKQQETARFLIVHRPLVYLLKKVLNQNQDAGLVRCPSCPKLTQKMSYGLTQTVDFVAWPLKSQPITHDWWRPTWSTIGPRKSGLPAQLTQKRSFGLTSTVDFVAWPPKTQPTAPRTGWRPTWRTIGPRKSGLLVQKIVILQIILCGAKLRERSINTLKTPWPPSGSRSRR